LSIKLEGVRRERNRREEANVTGYVAKAETEIEAPAARVWRALTDPDEIEQYMFGSRVETDWKPGSPIVWRGTYEGKAYEDKGEVVTVEPEHRLEVTHFSPLSGQDDVPANYHTLVYELEQCDGTTRVALSQDNNSSEEAAEHSKANWEKMLAGLKEIAER
jgi:uncharacterized protein YndB with AHSA1/START domain